MVKFNSIRKAISKKLAPKEDDATLMASQAAKDAQFQLQMQQYQQWQMQQMQMAQAQQQQGMMVQADPPSASMMNAVDPAASAPVVREAPAAAASTSKAIDVDMVVAESIEEARNEEEEVAPEEESSAIDEITENRDNFEPEETALANTSTEEESVVSEEEEVSVNETDDDECTGVMSYDEETYDGNDTEVKDAKSYDGSLAACEAMGNQKKFFHKDVVLHNLNEHSSGNDLVIRAMYFVPKPKSPEDVVVRIEASTVSPRDVMFCRGVGLEKRMLPFVPGFEIIGTVQTLGEAARTRGIFKEGQRVAGLSLNGGGNSRFISIPGDRLFHISRTVKSTNAVCLMHDYMAALKALRLAKKAGSPFTGMKMLVTDGFSPVGQAIIALANMEGASIYCCADIANHAYLASLGAKCFEKAPDTWLPSVSGTFDVVIDNSCMDSYSSSWFALNQRGTLVCLSPVFEFDRPRDAGCGIIDFGELQKKWAGVKAKYIMPHTHFFDTLRDYDTDREQFLQDMKYLTFLLEKGDITPKIAEKVALEDVPDAQRLMHSGKANGTIVCVPWIEN